MARLSRSRKPVGFFQNDRGHYSSLRLTGFLSLIAAIIFGFLTLSMKQSQGEGLYLTFGFLITAFAPKAVQKFAEKSEEK